MSHQNWKKTHFHFLKKMDTKASLAPTTAAKIKEL